MLRMAGRIYLKTLGEPDAKVRRTERFRANVWFKRPNVAITWHCWHGSSVDRLDLQKTSHRTGSSSILPSRRRYAQCLPLFPPEAGDSCTGVAQRAAEGSVE